MGLETASYGLFYQFQYKFYQFQRASRSFEIHSLLDEDVIHFSTLEEALQALEASDVLKEALGHDFVSWYCLLKRAGEIKALKNSDMKVDDEKAFEEERNMYAKFM